jgi:cbb3-type cytochrome oxidase subunit 3
MNEYLLFALLLFLNIVTIHILEKFLGIKIDLKVNNYTLLHKLGNITLVVVIFLLFFMDVVYSLFVAALFLLFNAVMSWLYDKQAKAYLNDIITFFI